MFCTTCGKKIQDGSRFCPFCGCAQDAPQQAQAAERQAQASPTAANMDSQVKQARKRSRGKIPTLLLIALVTMALAGTAFAAVYVYQTYIAPALEQSAPAGDSGTSNDPEKAQRVAYNSKLTQYKQAQDSGWQATDAADDSTLQGLVDVGSGELNWINSITAETLENGDIEYAFNDVNHDGTLELVVANLNVDDSIEQGYEILGLYTLDGSECVEVQPGGDQGISPVIYATGRFGTGYISGIGFYTYIYELQGASLVQVASWGTDASGIWVDDGSGQRVVTDEERSAFQQEYIGDGSSWTDFDWQPLSSFAPEE